MQHDIIISPEAQFLLVEWARAFHPWLFNSKTRQWTEKGQQHPLKDANLQQIQYALDQGRTPDMIRRAFREAKEAKQRVVHAYEAIAKSSWTLKDRDNLLLGQEGYTHPALFQHSGLLVERYTMADLLVQVRSLWADIPQVRFALRVLTAEHGVDVVLYATDALKRDGWKPKTPWGLRCFFDAARQDRDQAIETRKSLRAEANILKGTSTYAGKRPDLDWATSG